FKMTDPSIPLFKVFMADSVKDAVVRVLYSGYIGEGPEVMQFERELAEQISTKQLLTTNSGTSALHLAIHMALNGDRNSEIISTPITCTASNIPIIHDGVVSVWADVNPLTGNIDPRSIEKSITRKTKAIMMVRGGNPCDIAEIIAIARAHDIKVIEDAAHALGSTYAGAPIGTHSDYVAFSFQAIKHVTSVDGGCLVCRSHDDWQRGKLLRWYGIDRMVRDQVDLRCEIDIPEAGYKFHMNDVAAAIGRENLKHLPWIVDRQRDNAQFYDAAFNNVDEIRLSPVNAKGSSATWLYTIHVNNRDYVMRRLLEAWIGASKVHRNDTHSAFAVFRSCFENAVIFERTHLCILVG